MAGIEERWADRLTALTLTAVTGAAAAQTAPEPNPAPGRRARGTADAGSGANRDRDGAGDEGTCSATMLGSICGVRTRLEDYGITLGLTETSEVLGNVTGGRNQGVVYEGQTPRASTSTLARPSASPAAPPGSAHCRSTDAACPPTTSTIHHREQHRGDLRDPAV